MSVSRDWTLLKQNWTGTNTRKDFDTIEITCHWILSGSPMRYNITKSTFLHVFSCISILEHDKIYILIALLIINPEITAPSGGTGNC